MTPPSVSLPKGGGAIRGIGEKFAANPVNGTATFSVPLAVSPGRAGFGPQLALAYDSAAGNGPFGFGWKLGLPMISRRTDKGLPLYRDREGSDVFLFSGSEDLVPVLLPDGSRFEDTLTAPAFTIHRYRPRTEGLFARIERWTANADGAVHWRSISRDNVTTLYGTDDSSRIADPADPTRIFSWLIRRSHDDKGNAVVYEYAAEDDAGVDGAHSNERNRLRASSRYIKRVVYGNRTSRLVDPDLASPGWMFEVVFDYDEGHVEQLPLDPGLAPDAQHRYVRASASPAAAWTARPDPFSNYRATFEVRTYRRCRRVLMFHRFEELGAEPCLVRSTEFDYRDLDYSVPVAIDAELAHPGSTRFASFIASVTHSGYVRDATQPVVEHDGGTFVTYLVTSLPPVELEYSRAVIQDDVRAVDAESLEGLPSGLDGRAYRWVDLDGEGVAGILTDQAGGWFYKASLGGGSFGPMEIVAAKPSMADLGGGRQQLLDLAGDGQLDLAEFDDVAPGFYERTFRRDWKPFRPFGSLPNVRWQDPNLRFVDLDGDGRPDVLITEHELFTWHPSLGEEGYGPAQNVQPPVDEEKGPRLVLADGTESIYLADMSGDGLTDLVRIRNGEVCYWPNLGYGRFGAKVTMDDAPWFDHPDQFDQRRIRLADIDGSGTTDILYLGRDEIRIHFNQSGNRLSEPRSIDEFPRWNDLSAVTAADLLGNGTGCLVWSSALPHDAHSPMRYIDLMGGQKPHLLVRVVNNRGAETLIEYAASSKFYLADKRAGQPWVTRIPFPVHVVERTSTWDRISGNLFVTRYAYHHGYFDGVEREFRGFGIVEQQDTEEFAALDADQHFPDPANVSLTSHVPPVITRTWFHTGVFLGRGRVSRHFEHEYYREPGLTDAEANALLLDDTVLPAGLTIDEEREACRALKGAMLRQEVYALDESPRQDHPYSVVEQNFTVERAQPMGGNRHAVFFTHPRESLGYHYERDPADPRIAHTLTLEVDGFGNVLRSAAIGYGRRHPDPALDPGDQAEQAERHVTYTENGVTNAIDAPTDYRAPMPCEARTYEVTGLSLPPASRRFAFADVLDGAAAAMPLAYEEDPTAGMVQRRLVEHVRTYYRRDDLAASLPLGELQPLALPFENDKLAFTPGLVAQVYGGRVTDAMIEDEARYVHTEGDASWWMPSGRVFYSPDPAHTPAQELALARQHFFLPRRYRDPFHTALVSTESFVTYDPYDLLVQETCDALGNRVTVGERDLDPTQPPVALRQDYRVLQPALVMDINRNRSEVAFDALGMVVGTAVMGKPAPAPAEGDSLIGFRADLTQAEIDQFLANPKGPLAASLLADATTRVVYDLTAYWRGADPARKPPPVVATLARETHATDPVPAGGLRVQVGLAYSDGFGREIQRKIQAEPGPVPTRDAAGQLIVGPDGQPVPTADDVSPRWVGSGWTVFNNKGKPVRQYEPFFTDTHRFEFDVRIGVSPVLFYDPVDRLVVTAHPNHTWEKFVFDPWRQETWDVNDTALLPDPKSDPDVGDFFGRLPDAAYLPTWHSLRTGAANAAAFAARYPDPTDRTNQTRAAEKAGVHAATPAVAHADSLGRVFLTVTHNRFQYSDAPPAPPVDEFQRTRVMLDIEGNQREVIDAKDRLVVRHDYDMLGNRVHQASMEAGARWMLNDVSGKALYAWDSRDRRFRTACDPLHRPTATFVRDGAAAEIAVGRSVYGESRPDPDARNLRGKVVQIFDQAGVMTSDDYDFKGNLLSSRRQLAELVDPLGAGVPAYKTPVDWSVVVQLQTEAYASRTRYDALNRRTQLTAPHGDQPGAAVNVIQPIYNEANLLEQVHLWLDQGAEPAHLLDPATASLHAVTDIDYDAKGQRRLIAYGNGAVTAYDYDPLTASLVHQVTGRRAADFPDDCRQPAPAGWPGCEVQHLRYTYDPAGNITQLRDEAQQTIYFRNTRVEPSAEYTYDALYRLIEATGREHLGQVGGSPWPHSYNDAPRVGVLHPGDGNAMGRYLERYVYDAAGNLLSMQHRGSDPANPGWSRTYAYDEPSGLEPAKASNRLTGTTVGGTIERYSTLGDGYDAHGSLQRMPQLQTMQWDVNDQLQMTQRQKVDDGDADGVARHGERTWYVYDSAGRRVRKVTERADDGGLKDERIYLGAFEIYRRPGGPGADLVRETLHVMDDKQRIAVVETRTHGDEPGVPDQLIRYQVSDHLGSARLELDDAAQIISYEEYTPHGCTSYQAARSQTETPKRYRYTGKERDEESGLCYHGARYYVPWLGRWTSCDPLQSADNPYAFVRNNPIRRLDPDGKDDKQPTPTGSYTTPNNRGDLGTLIHTIVLRTIQLRLAALGVGSAMEVATLPDGSKNMKTTHSGRVDLAILLPDPKKPGSYIADLYDLKPHNVEAYRDYQSEVHHYTEHFPPNVAGLPVSSARIGDSLRIVEKMAPQVFDPIQFSYGSIEVSIKPSLARDVNNQVVPGLLTYDIGVRHKRPGEDDNVLRVKNMLRTSINQTAAAQAHGIVRASFMVGGAINTLNALAQLAILAGGALALGGAGAGATAGAEATTGAAVTGVGTTTGVGTATATATGSGLRIAVPTLYRIAVSSGTRVAGVRIATGVGEAVENEALAEEFIETATEIGKKLVMTAK